MDVLVDTHIAIWAFEDNARLSPEARDILLDPSSTIYCSVISAWEVAIKHTVHPDDVLVDEGLFLEKCRVSRFVELPLRGRHVSELSTLKLADGAPRQKDPFDRMLIAQAKADGLLLLTHDSKLASYNEPCVRLV